MEKLKSISVEALASKEELSKILQDYNENLKKITELDKEPNEESSMFNNGCYHLFRKEYEKAAKYLEEGIQKGEIMCAIPLQVMGLYYLIGFSVEQDIAKGTKYLEESSILGLGDEFSTIFLRQLFTYLAKNGIEEYYQKAFYYNEKLSKTNDVEAFINLGTMYLEGIGVEQDESKAIECYEKAVELGDKEALSYLGKIYYNKKDFDMAFKYYQKASGRIGGIADYMLGNMYYYGKGVEVNYEKAAQYYILAAGLGHIRATIKASILLHEGKGISQNDREAAYFLDKAIRQFEYEASKNEPTQKEKKMISLAYNNLGIFYIDGIGVEIDYKLAIENLEKAINCGEYTAALTLGQVYEEGLGVTPDKEKAIKYYQLAIDNGITGAQEELDRISSGKPPVRQRKKEDNK